MGIIKKAALKVRDRADDLADGIAALDQDQKDQAEQWIKEAQSRREDGWGAEQIQDRLGAAGVEIYQDYLAQLKCAYEPKEEQPEAVSAAENRICWFDITKWVTDPKEKDLDKLVNVYQVLSDEDCNIALIYHRRQHDCRVTVAVVNTADSSDPTIANAYKQRLVDAIRGNFPGAELKTDGGQFGIPPCLRDAAGEDGADRRVRSVAVVSNLASEKSEDFVSQTMEKLLDGVVPASAREEYVLVLLAKPVRDQLLHKNDLFQMYSELAPYASWQVSHAVSKANTVGSSGIVGGNVNIGMHAGFGTPGGRSVGASASFGLNFARTTNVSVQIGENEAVTETYTNYGVQYALKAIEEQLKKLDESAALGMWEFAAYALSDSPVTANNVARMYLALTQGKSSFMTNASVNLWYGNDEKDRDAARRIIRSVQTLRHPQFVKNRELPEWRLYPEIVTPSVLLSGGELARSLNFPGRSVSGLPVLESVPFGREVQRLAAGSGAASARQREDAPAPSVVLGRIYHMRRAEDTPVPLDMDSLASHVFITGSTGAGKSNTVYQLLDGLTERDVRFLVIEPAKGEYKNVFGGRAAVYGTNPKLGQLLRINPFSFPAGIHIYEHLDRLVEIFNVCWPMYAAMPAVLKDAVERAYVKAGWDLRRSVNRYDSRLFPDFADVLAQIDEVMEQSQYSSDNKSDYKGALSTRMRSLTNGINGMVFTADELPDEALFDENVIVDLSRVGSSETRALIMGLLVMKLQEHRMVQGGMNSGLKHITVLEEAHALLKRTSTEQSAESANLTGRAVEMLTNAIAEMRTYGEGFVIADQSPGLLDMAVIRNTNTKIIMRLPEYSDRELVGRAAGLNDEQIAELAKLNRGVAAVYQNDWLEAVLCQVDRFPPDRERPCRSAGSVRDLGPDRVKSAVLRQLALGRIYGLLDGVDSAADVLRADMPAGAKCALIEYDRAEPGKKLAAAAAVAYELLSAGPAFSALPKRKMDTAEQKQFLAAYLTARLTPPAEPFSDAAMDNILCLILYWHARCTNAPETRLLLAELVEREKIRGEEMK